MIQIYSTPTCHYCKVVKDYLTKNKIQYQELDVSSNLDNRKKMIEISGQMGVPVTIIDSTVIVGFNKEKLDKLLLNK
jgi:glutaredoxin-like YruB-family protein